MITGGQNPWEDSRPKFRRGRGVGSSVSPEEAVVTQISSGRLLAWHILQQHETGGQFVQDLLAAADTQHALPSNERAAAMDIAAGVVRRKRTIDRLLQSQISRPRQQVENDLWRMLQVGVFQLVFGRTPDHAAVDSTVDLCRNLGRERWTKFVNGVLRNVGRLLTEEWVDEPAADALPTVRGQFRRLHQPIFANPADDLPKYAAEAFSLPTALAERWVRHMSLHDLLSACFHANDVPGITLRVNRLKNTDTAGATAAATAAATASTEVVQLLRAAGCQVRQGSLDASLHIIGATGIDSFPGFREGLWSIQDESAMSASLLLQPRPGDRILDLCAAPGGKSCHLAELSEDAAHILACDVSESRLEKVQESAIRLGIHSIQTQLVDREGTLLPKGLFDAIMVDVPCSNTGVLNRRPEARWRFDATTLQELIPLQTRLLLNACGLLDSGGRLVYSTCSAEPEENRGVVDAVLRVLPTFQLQQECIHRAGQPADGAYQALLIRSA